MCCRHYTMSFGHATLRRMHTVCKGLPPFGRLQTGVGMVAADIISCPSDMLRSAGCTRFAKDCRPLAGRKPARA